MCELARLRIVSESIRSFVDKAGAAIGAGLDAAAEDVSRISEQMATVGLMLSDGRLRRGQSDGIDTALQDYCDNLYRLRATLTAMEERLGSRREILMQQRQHLSAAGRWAAHINNIE